MVAVGLLTATCGGFAMKLCAALLYDVVAALPVVVQGR
jgi:hypothetical protein